MWLKIHDVFSTGSGTVDILLMKKTGTVHTTPRIQDGIMKDVLMEDGTISVRSDVALNFIDDSEA